MSRTQNIRHYAVAQKYDDVDSSATVIVAKVEGGGYLVQACNLVEKNDGEVLLARINELAAMDKVELKALYKAQLRMPRVDGSTTGAGLGLLFMARKSAQPLCASLAPSDAGRLMFSLSVVI